MRLIFAFLCFLITAVPLQSVSAAEAPELPRGAQVIGTAGSGGFTPPFDQQIKGELDKLLPQLKQLPVDATILIEVHYPERAGVSKAQRTESAYVLGEQVQQHLKVRHGLDRAYFVTLRNNGGERAKQPKVRLISYPRDFFEN